MARVRVDEGQVAKFAEYLRATDDAKAFDFCSLSEGFIYPERDRAGVLEYFFFACAHQFGFWTLEGGRWRSPMIATLAMQYVCNGAVIAADDGFAI